MNARSCEGHGICLALALIVFATACGFTAGADGAERVDGGVPRIHANHPNGGTVTVYKWSTGLLVPLDVTLAGDATDVWIFQVAGDVDISAAMSVTLTGGALATNVFWQVSGSLTAGATAHFEGVVLTQTFVTLGTGTSVNGRLLAQTAVTLAGSTIVQPAS